MTDLFREIEQDMRREQATELWEKYGIFLVGAAVVIVVAVAATVGWEAYRGSRAQDASFAFDKLIAEAAKQPGKAADSFAKFAEDAPRGYETLALFRQAATLADATNVPAAVAVYDKIAEDKDVAETLRGLAQIKAGLLLVDTASYDDIKARMTSMDQADAPWRNHAREILGISAFKARQYSDAQGEFAAIIADATVPPALRERAQVMQALIAPNLAPTVTKDETEAAAPADAKEGDKEAKSEKTEAEKTKAEKK